MGRRAVVITARSPPTLLFKFPPPHGNHISSTGCPPHKRACTRSRRDASFHSHSDAIIKRAEESSFLSTIAEFESVRGAIWNSALSLLRGGVWLALQVSFPAEQFYAIRRIEVVWQRTLCLYGKKQRFRGNFNLKDEDRSQVKEGKIESQAVSFRPKRSGNLVPDLCVESWNWKKRGKVESLVSYGRGRCDQLRGFEEGATCVDFLLMATKFNAAGTCR